MALQIHTAPASSAGKLSLGRTLPSLLDEAVEAYPNPTAFNNPKAGGGWDTTSNGAFRTAADEIAVGLLESGLERGDRLAMFMDSDLHFSLVDFGSLIAGVLNVPLYTTFAEDNLVFVTEHSEAKALVVTNPQMLARFAAWAPRVPSVRLVVLATGTPGADALPEGVRLLTLDALREAGRTAIAAAPNRPDELRDLIDAQDVATLIYTSGTTGQPKGVMLTHENISSNVLGSFSAFGILGHQEETILTYLPLTHIFARMVVTAHITWGHSVHYSDPDHLVEHLPAVRPTVFASVPRVLEKVYDKVTLTMQEATGLKGKIGGWAMAMAPTYETGSTPSGLRAVQFGLADKLVYSKLREKLGLTRIKAVVIGGAALRPALSNAFNAFGVPTYQGYGLTETSPVITVGTPTANKAGSVGPPIPGAEVAIAEDGEILTRGPHVMKGYYKADDLTAEVVDADGWFHTGDIGEFTPEGYLRITDRKKALFKLSTGKYVIPQPIENALMEHALIEQAVVVGNNEKYATALLFPSADNLSHWAKGQGIAADGIDALIQDPKVTAEFERLVAEANRGCDHWSQVKRFRLVPEPMTVDNGLLTPKMSVKRSDVSKRYATDIALIYKANVKEGAGGVAAVV
jgi:long-chain acyl-CoA synthetase